ncbi:MAG: hypothetical protein ACI80V_000827 [Rhodothermales bacterium]|jgi:hypothetical protein
MKRILLLVAAATLSLPATAQIGIGLRAGTLGPGIEVAYAISPKLSVRATGSYLTHSRTEEIDEDDITLELDAKATVGAFGALLDFHPFGNFFRLTGGVTVNLFDVAANGLPTDDYCFGDSIGGVCDGKVFSPDRMGTFGANVSYASSIAPYAGIGFGKIAGRRRIGLLMDIGALYAGSPEVDLVATGLLTPTASIEQEAILNTGVETFTWYPVVSFGIAIRL